MDVLQKRRDQVQQQMFVELGKQIGAHLYAQLWGPVLDEIEYTMRDEMEPYAPEIVRDQVYYQVRIQAQDQVLNQVHDQIVAPLLETRSAK